MSGVLITRNADGKPLCSVVLSGFSDPVVAAHEFMDYLRKSKGLCPYCCEVWHYKTKEVLKLLVTVF